MNIFLNFQDGFFTVHVIFYSHKFNATEVQLFLKMTFTPASFDYMLYMRTTCLVLPNFFYAIWWQWRYPSEITTIMDQKILLNTYVSAM
jgi:hypothetical protein